MTSKCFYTTLLVAALCVLPLGFLLAQEGRVNGKITNGTDSLPGATVTIGDQSIITNINGSYTYSGKPGSYTLTITHTGYKKIEQQIIIEADATHIYDFVLVPSGILDEISVLGTRAHTPRSSLNTAVPIDAFSSQLLKQTGQFSAMQMLNYLAPSVNVSRDLANEPIALYGLDPQHLLITLNQTRYHNQVLMNTGSPKGILGKSSVSNDLSSIPFAAVEVIEILHYGATAQYGSDAIAAVMNLRLKENTGKTEISLHNGQYYDSDGEKLSLDIYRGFSLVKKGFISIAGSFNYRAPTCRGGIYDGPVYVNIPSNASVDDIVQLRRKDDSIINARNFDRRKAIGNIGNIQQLNAGILLNSAYKIKSNTELFGTVAFNNKTVRRQSEFKFPKDTNAVNLALFPDGFGSISTPNTRDVTVIAGIRGEIKNKWHWDVTSSFGRNHLISHISNSNNASQSYLGRDAPTDFRVGQQFYNQLTNNINLIRKFKDLPENLNLLNVGLGIECRWENFRTKSGDSASWEDYDFAFNSYTLAGSQGNVGISPDDVVNKDRISEGAYIDVETEIRNKLLLNFAGRYEYYNDFGSNLAGKLAIRYKLRDNCSFRGSIGNGFRAPSLQQRFMRSFNDKFYLGPGGTKVLRGGIFPSDHTITKAFGIAPLTAETSLNLSGGLTGKIYHIVSFTVDAYWIQVYNRIVLSGIFDKNNPEAKIILDNYNGQNRSQVEKIQFFTNAINTRTKGIDAVLSGNWKIKKSILDLVVAANFNQTRLFGKIKTTDKLGADSVLFNIEEKARLEKGQPNSKIILTIGYRINKFLITFRNTCFGNTSTVTLLTKDTLNESYSSKLITDFSIGYSLKKWVSITAGANNIFDVYPDKIKNYKNTSEGRLIYSPDASPFGFNGGYYYVNMRFEF